MISLETAGCRFRSFASGPRFAKRANLGRLIQRLHNYNAEIFARAFVITVRYETRGIC